MFFNAKQMKHIGGFDGESLTDSSDRVTESIIKGEVSRMDFVSNHIDHDDMMRIVSCLRA